MKVLDELKAWLNAERKARNEKRLRRKQQLWLERAKR